MVGLPRYDSVDPNKNPLKIPSLQEHLHASLGFTLCIRMDCCLLPVLIRKPFSVDVRNRGVMK